MKTHKRRRLDRTFCGLDTRFSCRVFDGPVLCLQIRHYWKDVTCKRCQDARPKEVVHKFNSSGCPPNVTVCGLDLEVHPVKTSWEGRKDVTCKSCKLRKKRR